MECFDCSIWLSLLAPYKSTLLMVIVCKHLIDHVSWWIDLFIEWKYVTVCIRQHRASELRVCILCALVCIYRARELRVCILPLLVHARRFALWLSKLHRCVLIISIVATVDRRLGCHVRKFRMIAERMSVDMIRVALLQVSIPLGRYRLRSNSVEGVRLFL